MAIFLIVLLHIVSPPQTCQTCSQSGFKVFNLEVPPRSISARLFLKSGEACSKCQAPVAVVILIGVGHSGGLACFKVDDGGASRCAFAS